MKTERREIGEEEREGWTAGGDGAVCTLHYTGQQRSKLLATLYKDERCLQLPAYNILEKM